jgi:hypothetical protein
MHVHAHCSAADMFVSNPAGNAHRILTLAVCCRCSCGESCVSICQPACYIRQMCCLLHLLCPAFAAAAAQALTEEADAAAAEVARLETADICSMWADDLDAFLEVGTCDCAVTV